MNKNLSPKNSNDKRIVNRAPAVPVSPPPKRDNTFSQSRDIREDRSLRQMKNQHSAKAFPHVR
jgi:hypothetical protein